ncbi:MAG: hypothetical protein GX971_10750 [Firmicutes bacterium]|nr:hypothetical protein [Bacillota bacterium]
MYLAIDIGTSSIKAALGNGEQLWVEQYQAGCSSVGTHSEQDPKVWLRGVGMVIPALLAHAGISAKDIKAISLSSHSPSVVPVDLGGNPLLPCFTWQDRRATKQAQRITELTSEFTDPSFFAPKMLWIKENHPEIYHKTQAFLQPKDYLIHYLTGEMITDRASAFFNQANRIPELDQGKLPCPVNNWEIVGLTHASAEELGLIAGIPVVSGGIDAYCEALGAGLVEEGDFGDVTGTSICLSYCFNDSGEQEGVVPHVIPERSLTILPMSSGGGTLAWFLDSVVTGIDYADLGAVLNASPPGANGLLFLPYLAGERSPIWDEQAKGVFFGVTKAHQKADFLRALLEGVAFAIRHNLEILSDRGLRPREVRATGGGARLTEWNQIKADVTGLPYHQLETVDGALLGGILLGAYAVEKRPIAELVQEYVKVKCVLEPSSCGTIYDVLYDKYKRLYESTKELMR